MSKEQNMFNAYSDDAMTQEQAFDYETRIVQGDLQLPPEEKIKRNMFRAYSEGAMTPGQSAKYFKGLNDGTYSIPIGAEGFQSKGPKTEDKGFWASMGDLISGSSRETEEEQAAGSFRQLPEKAVLPQMKFGVMTNPRQVWDAFTTSLATLTTSPDETAKIIQANFPEVKARQDEKENWIFTSAIDDKDYAIHPGMKFDDIASAFPSIAAFMTVGKFVPGIGKGNLIKRTQSLLKLAAGAAGVELASEAQQASVGGEFNIANIALGAAGEFGGAALAKLAKATVSVIKKGLPPEIATEGLARLIKNAAGGSMDAMRKLAAEGASNPKIKAAAAALGIDLTAGQMAISNRFRTGMSAIESISATTAEDAASKSHRQLADAAVSHMDNIGTIKDAQEVSDRLLVKHKELTKDLKDQADVYYNKVNDAIESTTPTPATNLKKYLLEEQVKLGGEGKLPPQLQKLLDDFDTDQTYYFVEQKRRELTRSRVGKMDKSEFSNIDKRQISLLEDALMEDQMAIAKSAGLEDTYKKGQQLTAIRKGVEENMEEMFGKKLDRIFGRSITRGLKDLDTGEFSRLVSKIPQEFREEVVGNSLYKTFLNKDFSPTKYAKWYEGLLENKRARTALLTSLPPGTEKKLSDLYTVADALKRSDKKYIGTGKLRVFTEELQHVGQRMDNVMEVVKKTLPIMAAEGAFNFAGFQSMGGVSMGALLWNATRSGRNKIPALEAASNLITSPRFRNMVDEQGALKIIKTQQWKRFVKEVGAENIGDPVHFLLGAAQATKPREGE